MNYKNLEVWRKSMKVALLIHTSFKGCKDYGFKDQITRSATSIPSNIAEGEERETVKESVRFLYIAKGSAGELYTQILLAKEFGYLSGEQYELLQQSTLQVSRMLAGLIKSRVYTVK
ncbi:four helix bundle protein [Vibrio aphrogenes]|uniref:four helix bundle protein n=1 Tax=Vibrio aphrogenes TaxID=1891186 RepID=UPI000B34F6E6|nr:four helix bundle protein [Vibrio aphrogenes]